LSPVCGCVSCPTHPTPSGSAGAYPWYPSSSITHAQWEILGPLLPPPGNTRGRGGRNQVHSRRLILDAIFYVVRGGIAWRQLPSDFPPPTSVYDVFTQWIRAGVWVRVHDTVRDLVRVHEGRDRLPTAAVIDSQSVRGGDTVPGYSRGYDAGKKINGRKRHIAVDTGGLLLAVVVTIAAIQDRDAAARLLAALRARFSTISLVWADGGYAGRLVTWAKTVLNMTVEIVKRSDDIKGFKVLPRRWVVERSFAWLSKYRRCVRDHETLPEVHETMVYIASIMLMSRRLARTGDW
jgi:transposase